MAKYCPATNFSLERLLALIRAASPKCKGRKPTATKVIARGMLTQMMRQHLDNGLKDHRGQEKRSDLIKKGVCINAKSRKSKGTSTGARWHIRYGNFKVSKMLEEQGGTIDDCDKVRAEAAKEWTTLPSAQRLAFKASYKMQPRETEGDDGDDGDDEAEDEQTIILKYKLSPWVARTCSKEWPLDPSHLEPALISRGKDTTPCAHVRGSSHGRGIVNRYREIREGIVKEQFVKDSHCIPDGPIKICAACFQVHPGLCVTRDGPYYNLARQIAACMEHHFSKDLLHLFHRIRGTFPESVDFLDQYVYFAHKRRRGRKVPITHVFVKCERQGNDIKAVDRAEDLFDYCTVWLLAREFVSAGCNRIGSIQVSLERIPMRSNGCFVICDEQSFETDVEIWPSPPERAPVETDPDEIPELDRKKKRRKTTPKSGFKIVMPDLVTPDPLTGGLPLPMRELPTDNDPASTDADDEHPSESSHLDVVDGPPSHASHGSDAGKEFRQQTASRRELIHVQHMNKSEQSWTRSGYIHKRTQ